MSEFEMPKIKPGHTREEHLQWCKDRALPYISEGDILNGVTSMMSDLMKHPETIGVSRALAPVAMHVILEDDKESARRFIEGFR